MRDECFAESKAFGNRRRRRSSANSLTARKGWVFGPPPVSPNSTPEAWAQRHRELGHQPYAAPTEENPERWRCECGHVWRILTEKQSRQRWYGMMGRAHLLPPGDTR